MFGLQTESHIESVTKNGTGSKSNSGKSIRYEWSCLQNLSREDLSFATYCFTWPNYLVDTTATVGGIALLGWVSPRL